MEGRVLPFLVATVFLGYLMVPPTVSQQLNPGDLPNLNVSSINDWKENCRITVGKQAVEDIENSQKELMPCLQSHINMQKLEHEVNVSYARGDMDLVFKKYCKKRDKLMACAEDMFTKIEICANDQQKQDLNITRRAIDAGIDFVCHDGGDRIALFMADKGKECLMNHSTNIGKCVEDKVPEMKELKDNSASINIAKFIINEENCKKLNAMEECVVEHTSKCDDETPANILGSLIKQILKVTPCSQANSASTILSHTQYLLPHLLTLVAAALTAANILL